MRRENDYKMNERPRILIVGDAVASTGFARVMHSIFTHLHHHYEIHHLGINYMGDPHDMPWKIYPARLGGDFQGVTRIGGLIRELKPSLVFMLNDIWVLGKYMKKIGELEKKPGIIMYCPIDNGPVDPEDIEALEGVDEFVVYTGFAKTEIEKALSTIKETNPRFNFPEVKVMPHGVEHRYFYPFFPGKGGEPTAQGRSAAIQSLYGDDRSFDDAFIVLNANRNQPRKRIDISIKGFAEFARNKPDNVKLHLHMGIEDMGWDVIRLAKRYGIYDRLILTNNGNSIPSVPINQLNTIYNAASVGINTSVGEGWGLVAFEHGATGGAQIVPGHSGCLELWNGSALMLNPVMTVTNERILTDAMIVSSEQLSQSLEKLYEDPKLLREMSLTAWQNANQKQYCWELIAQRWGEILGNVLKERVPVSITGSVLS